MKSIRATNLIPSLLSLALIILYIYTLLENDNDHEPNLQREMAKSLLPLFISLALISLFIENVSCNGPTLKFSNKLRPDPEDGLIITCDGGYKKLLNPGETSPGPSVSGSQAVSCRAVWWTDYANFKGYAPDRDGANKNLNWKMNEGGVFLSYDNAKFKKIAKWKAEQ